MYLVKFSSYKTSFNIQFPNCITPRWFCLSKQDAVWEKGQCLREITNYGGIYFFPFPPLPVLCSVSCLGKNLPGSMQLDKWSPPRGESLQPEQKGVNKIVEWAAEFYNPVQSSVGMKPCSFPTSRNMGENYFIPLVSNLSLFWMVSLMAQDKPFTWGNSIALMSPLKSMSSM